MGALPQQIEDISAIVEASAAKWTASDAAILAMVKAITTANPIMSAPTVTTTGTWSWRGARRILSDGSLERFAKAEIQDEMTRSLNTNPSSSNLDYWMGYLTDPGPDASSTLRPIITADEQTALRAHITAAMAPQTEIDKAWSPTISVFEATYKRPPDLDDVRDARWAKQRS